MSRGGGELHTDRAGGAGEDTRGVEPPVAGIDPTGQHRVRSLVGDGQVLGRRLDAEMTRFVPTRPLLLDEGQRPLVAVDAKQHHAVVTAVGGVQELARRVYSDLRPGVE